MKNEEWLRDNIVFILNGLKLCVKNKNSVSQ